MKSRIALAVLLVAGAILFSASSYTVGEWDQVILTEFGAPAGEPVTEPGLHFKKPFIQEVNRFEKRVLRWNGEPREISTREKKFIFLDTMARWRIADPLLFLRSVRDLPQARQRLDNIIDGVVKDTVSSSALIDVVRSSNRRMQVDVESPESEPAPSVTLGRDELVAQITSEAAARLAPLGIALLDVRITRVIFVEKVLQDVYRRMSSERQSIAERFRSEGQGERSRVLGELDRDLKRIESEAFRDAERRRGEADAEAARIYAAAYERDPGFYAFVRSLETLRTAVADGSTTAVLSSGGDLFKLLREPGGGE